MSTNINIKPTQHRQPFCNRITGSVLSTGLFYVAVMIGNPSFMSKIKQKPSCRVLTVNPLQINHSIFIGVHIRLLGSTHSLPTPTACQSVTIGTVIVGNSMRVPFPNRLPQICFIPNVTEFRPNIYQEIVVAPPYFNENVLRALVTFHRNHKICSKITVTIGRIFKRLLSLR